MGEPHRHHFVPAFYLKHWADGNGKLVEYSRPNGKLMHRERGPERTGYEEHLYSFPGLPTNIAASIETKFFKPSDDMASRVLDKLLSGEHGPWTLQMRSAWARFLFTLRLRHADAMPEMRAAIKRAWANGHQVSEAEYNKIRLPGSPETFDEFLEKLDPQFLDRVGMHIMASAFDNEMIGNHIINMEWDVLDLSRAVNRLLTSDWAIDLSLAKGIVSLPISPTKLFIAANRRAGVEDIRRQNVDTIVQTVNRYSVGQARRYVWSTDRKQELFIKNRMSRRMVPQPFFPTLQNI